MCLIIDKKRNPRYIYKIFQNQSYGLYSYYRSYTYQPGKNEPQEIIYKNIPSRFISRGSVISTGALHAYTSYKKVLCNSYNDIIIRLPYDKNALIAFGNRSDVALKYINIPSIIYNRIIQIDKPNIITKYGSKVYF